MQLQQMRYVLAAAEKKSFSAAAKSLFYLPAIPLPTDWKFRERTWEFHFLSGILNPSP